MLCCSYDCNIERGLRLFAFHPSVLKELASHWMCVTDKGARWLFWFEKVCLSALPTSTHFWSHLYNPWRISLCIFTRGAVDTRRSFTGSIYSWYRWIVSHPGVDPDNVKYVRGCTKECAESTFCLSVSSSHHRSWPFLRAHFFNPSTLCSTWTGIDFINRTSSSSLLLHY